MWLHLTVSDWHVLSPCLSQLLLNVPNFKFKVIYLCRVNMLRVYFAVSVKSTGLFSPKMLHMILDAVQSVYLCFSAPGLAVSPRSPWAPSLGPAPSSAPSSPAGPASPAPVRSLWQPSADPAWRHTGAHQQVIRWTKARGNEIPDFT